MLGFLKIFNDKNRMSFYQLYSKLRKWKDSGTYPYAYELPEQITFPPDFWSEIIKLYKATRSDGFERAITVFWADGELIVSSVIRGNRRSVTPKSNVSVRYVRSKHEGYMTKEVYLNDKKYSSKDIYHKKVPKQIEVKYLFNMHTHPPHEMTDGSYVYSFFSAQDIRSLIRSGSVITGMIGDKFWLLVRTNKTPKEMGESIHDGQMNMEFLYRELHIEIYYGDFKSSLQRYAPQTSDDQTTRRS